MGAGRVLLALAFAFVTGCASAPAGDGPEGSGLAGRIWDVRAGRFIDEEALVERLRGARFRLLGEVHDHPVHHPARARLVSRLGPAEVFFEQFDREQDAALREAQSKGLDADALARAGKLADSWGWPLHRPIVEAGLKAGLLVRAANLGSAETRRIARAGALGAADARLFDALAKADWSEERDRAMRAEIMEGHCGLLPERAAPGMALAQRARDATLGMALQSASGPAVLIAGNGHVRRDLGVPAYLPRDASVLAVGFLETRPEAPQPQDYGRGIAGQPAFDFLWFTAPHPRPDPCEALRKR